MLPSDVPLNMCSLTVLSAALGGQVGFRFLRAKPGAWAHLKRQNRLSNGFGSAVPVN